MNRVTIGFQLKNLNLEFLSDFSGNWQFSVYETSIGNINNSITAFCAKTSGKTSLRKDWLAVTDAINNGYLTNVDSDFEHWNSYLLFIVDEKILKSDGLQFEIENDKFYMRKIVEYNIQNNIDGHQIINILNRKILSADINFQVSEYPDQKINIDSPAKPELIYQSLIDKKIPVDTTISAKGKRHDWLANELNRIKNHED